MAKIIKSQFYPCRVFVYVEFERTAIQAIYMYVGEEYVLFRRMKIQSIYVKIMISIVQYKCKKKKNIQG